LDSIFSTIGTTSANGRLGNFDDDAQKSCSLENN